MPPELYTAALRAVLVEWGAGAGGTGASSGSDPLATLPGRLAAADALAQVLGVPRPTHDQVRGWLGGLGRGVVRISCAALTSLPCPQQPQQSNLLLA